MLGSREMNRGNNICKNLQKGALPLLMTVDGAVMERRRSGARVGENSQDRHHTDTAVS